MSMYSYKNGDPVRIVAGKYKKYGHGTYLGVYGTVMCNVKVDGDTAPLRNLWLTSIRPIKKAKNAAKNTNTADADDSNLNEERNGERNDNKLQEELKAMIKEIEALRLSADRLESRVHKLIIDNV